MNLSDFNPNIFDFSDPEKYDDFDKEHRLDFLGFDIELIDKKISRIKRMKSIWLPPELQQILDSLDVELHSQYESDPDC